MSIQHRMRVRKRRIESLDPAVIANGINSDEIVLDLDDEWDGLSLTIFLGLGDTLLQAKYDPEKPCYIPSALIKNPGDRISFSLIGENKEKTVRLVTGRCAQAFRVAASGSFKGRR